MDYCYNADLSIADVILTTYGRDINDTIILCPDDDFVQVFECVVTGSTQFQWTLKPLLSQFQFLQTNEVGKRPESGVTLVLTEKELTAERLLYESQLQVPTSSVIEQLKLNNNHLEVTCGVVNSDPKKKYLRLSGKSQGLLCDPLVP